MTKSVYFMTIPMKSRARSVFANFSDVRSDVCQTSGGVMTYDHPNKKQRSGSDHSRKATRAFFFLGRGIFSHSILSPIAKFHAVHTFWKFCLICGVREYFPLQLPLYKATL